MDDIDSLVSGLLTSPADKGATSPDDGDPGALAGEIIKDGKTPPTEHGGSNNSPDAGDAGDKSNDTADNGDADTGEDHDGADTGDDNAEPEFDIAEGDKSSKVKLSELKSGYLRQADYTRKTQEVAAQRKALDDETAQTRQARQQYAGALEMLSKHLGDASGERTEEQWNQLRAADPAKYSQEYTDFVRRNDARKQVKAEQDRVRVEEAREGLKKLQTYVAGESEKLQAALPDFKDPVKAPKLMGEIRSFAKEQFGFTDQELDKAYDSRVIIMAKLAMDGIAASKAAKAAADKLAKAPDIQTGRAPGAKQVTTPKAAKERNREAALKQLEKTGDIRHIDAAALLLK